MDWNRSQGLGWARRLTDNLCRDETSALQIDSHSVFEIKWDTSLIAQWNENDDPRAVLSSYPPAFSFDLHGEVQFAAYLPKEVAIKEFVEPGVPRFYGRPTGNFTGPDSWARTLAQNLAPSWSAIHIPRTCLRPSM